MIEGVFTLAGLIVVAVSILDGLRGIADALKGSPPENPDNPCDGCEYESHGSGWKGRMGDQT